MSISKLDDYWLWLYYQKGIGSGKIRELRSKYNLWSVEKFLKAAKGMLKIKVTKYEIEQLILEIKRELNSKSVKAISSWSPLYPKPLLQIPDYPAFLFVKGREILNQQMFSKSVAIVGTRRMTEYGKSCVPLMVEPLVDFGYTIISGLASGVDAEVHKVMIERKQASKDTTCNGIPVAILSGGPCGGFPEMNRSLYESILHCGIVISEFQPGIALSPGMFASRNRVIAGLSKCVVVIEAPIKSGALITADLALQYNREVCAVPGSIFKDTSSGTNELISQGAYPVRNGFEILAVLEGESQISLCKNEEFSVKVVKKFISNFGINEDLAKTIYDVIIDEGISLESLSKKVNISIVDLRVLLTKMEVEGILTLGLDGRVRKSI